MSQAVNTEKTVSSPMRALYEPIQDAMEQVELLLRQELQNEFNFVDQLLRYGGQLGGKRLRPALLLLTARATGEINRDHHVLAAVVEMIHTATLIHDDVLDEADMRRHLATVNSRWNNETSVLLGDYLFTHAFYLASTLDSTYACRRIGRSTNLVCEGELRQVDSRGNHGLTEEDYLSIINGKTAELCACSAHLGAKYAEAENSVVSGMERYGRSLGMAFQIADDLLDLLGDESATGKSLGTDLEKQKPTLPIIHVYRQANRSERRQLVDLLNAPAVQSRRELSVWLDRFEAIDYARNRAAQFAADARAELEPLCPSAARDVLMDITEFVVARSM